MAKTRKPNAYPWDLRRDRGLDPEPDVASAAAVTVHEFIREDDPPGFQMLSRKKAYYELRRSILPLTTSP